METTLINYIEDNKEKYNISYAETLDYLQEVLDELKQEYQGEK